MSICDLCQLSSPSGCAKLSNEVCLKEALKLIKATATNGDVIKALWNVTEVDDNYKLTTFIDIDDVPWVMSTDKDWWNAPYKVGDTDGNSCSISTDS